MRRPVSAWHRRVAVVRVVITASGLAEVVITWETVSRRGNNFFDGCHVSGCSQKKSSLQVSLLFTRQVYLTLGIWVCFADDATNDPSDKIADCAHLKYCSTCCWSSRACERTVAGGKMSNSPANSSA